MYCHSQPQNKNALLLHKGIPIYVPKCSDDIIHLFLRCVKVVESL
jgi:hypothetical protein